MQDVKKEEEEKVVVEAFCIFKKYFGNILEIIWKYFGNILEIAWIYFGNILEIVLKYFGNILQDVKKEEEGEVVETFCIFKNEARCRGPSALTYYAPPQGGSHPHHTPGR